MSNPCHKAKVDEGTGNEVTKREWLSSCAGELANMGCDSAKSAVAPPPSAGTTARIVTSSPVGLTAGRIAANPTVS